MVYIGQWIGAVIRGFMERRLECGELDREVVGREEGECSSADI